MFWSRLVFCSLALLAADIRCAWAQAALSRPYIVAASGRSLEVAKYTAINPDCTSLGPIGVNLVVAPQGGEVRVGEGRRYMAFVPANPRSACNRRKIPATFVLYRSQPGFTGQDSFVVEVVFPNGTAQRARITVNVR